MNMLKGLAIQQQQQQSPREENMSNITSASGEASVSSTGNRAESGGGVAHPHPQHYVPPLPPPATTQSQPPAKRKRTLPGNPDPDAEVIALSPKALLATNRFVCEICNKGFQRDQNLQLHRRGHNLPWKLKQRTSKEAMRKKVYVCPEKSCVHHDPSRALGDLTGIKKHFCRKHGEKKWKCDKCSKRYAVQSDWKAHSKTCGTREYRCDCGTLFSRRDSFITHRAFCDALAEESARTVPGNNINSNNNNNNNTILPNYSQQGVPGNVNSTSIHVNLDQTLQQRSHQISHGLNAFSMKKEDPNFHNLWPDQNSSPWMLAPCPPMVGHGPPSPIDLLTSSTSSSIFSTRLDHHQFLFDQSLNPNPSLGPTIQLPSYHPSTVPTTATNNASPPFSSSAHMSATALLQKAAQMGATMRSNSKASTTSSSSPSGPAEAIMPRVPHLQAAAASHVSSFDNNPGNCGTSYSLKYLSPREEMVSAAASAGAGQVQALTSYGNKAAISSAAGLLTNQYSSPATPAGITAATAIVSSSSFLQDIMSSPHPSGLPHSAFSVFDDGQHSTILDPFDHGVVVSSSSGKDVFSRITSSTVAHHDFGRTSDHHEEAGAGHSSTDGMTRDFLGF